MGFFFIFPFCLKLRVTQLDTANAKPEPQCTDLQCGTRSHLFGALAIGQRCG